MRFVIESVIRVDGSDKYTIGGYLTATGSELDVLHEMQEGIHDFVVASGAAAISDAILIDGDRIYYNNIPIDTCFNVITMYKTGIGVDIAAEFSPLCRFTPANCAQMIKFEISSLFN